MSTLRTKHSNKNAEIIMKKGKSDDLEPYNRLLYDYSEFMDNGCRKHNTISLYVKSAVIFIYFLTDEHIELASLTKENVITFLYLIEVFPRFVSLTKARYKGYIKKFLNWLHDSHYISFSGDQAIQKIIWHRDEPLPSVYTSEEVSRILDAVDISTRKGKEHYLILSIIVYLGWRISDVAYLRLSNIDFEKREIRFKTFKTHKEVCYVLLDEIMYPLLDYLMNVRPKDTDLDYVFLTLDKPYRCKEEIRHRHYIVTTYMDKAGIDYSGRHHGFHCLRHSLATRMIEDNTDVYTVQTILGHESPNVTMDYIGSNIKGLKDCALEVPYVPGIH